jgi:hypothetical protein
MSTEQPVGGEHPDLSASPPIGPAPAPVSARTAVQSAYQREASGDLVAMSFPGARRIAGWLFWVVFPIVCIGALVIAVNGIVGHLNNHPDGIRGTYVANRTCSRGICLVGGTFVSDDKRITVTSLLGDPRWATGTTHKVIYDGTSAEVIGLGQWDGTPSVLAAIGALTYLGVVGYFLRAVRRERRHPPDPIPAAA